MEEDLLAVAGIVTVVLILCVLVGLIFAVLAGFVLALVILGILLILRIFAHDDDLLSYGNSIGTWEDIIQEKKNWGWKNERRHEFFAKRIFRAHENDGAF